MAEKTSDAIALWQRMFGEMQKGFGSLANQASGPATDPASVGEAAPKQLADFMERYFVSMGMPSRAQIGGIAEQLRTIEGQLDDIRTLLQDMQMASKAAPQPAAPRAARPSRQKRASSTGEEQK